MSCSFKSEAYPGQYIRHQCYRARINEKSDEQTRKDASFFNRPGLLGGPGYVSFEAEHFPGHYLRVRGGTEIWLDKHDGSEQFSREATFRLVPGLGNPMGVSVESLAFPGYFWREQGFMVNLFSLASDQSEYARREMTWHIEGAGVSAPMASPVPTSTAWAPAPPSMSGGPFHPGGHYPGGPAPGATMVPQGAAMPMPSGPGGMAYGYPGAMPTPGTPGSFPAAIGATININSFNFAAFELRHQQYRLKISEGSDAQAKLDSEFKLQPSIAGVGGYFSFESCNFPGHYVRVRGGGSNEVWLDRFDGNPQFAKEASFKLVPGLANPSSYWSFESLALPGHFLRHANFVAFVSPNTGDATFRQDGTWSIKQIGLSPAGYGAPGAAAGSYPGAVPGYGQMPQAPLPGGPAAGWAGGPSSTQATTPFAGQPQAYYGPVAGQSSMPGMPQVISQAPGAGMPGAGGMPGMMPGMMPGGYPGAPGAMPGYPSGYGGGMAPPMMPGGAYPPAMMGTPGAPPAMMGSGQQGMYQPRPY